MTTTKIRMGIPYLVPAECEFVKDLLSISANNTHSITKIRPERQNGSPRRSDRHGCTLRILAITPDNHALWLRFFCCCGVHASSQASRC